LCFAYRFVLAYHEKLDKPFNTFSFLGFYVVDSALDILFSCVKLGFVLLDEQLLS